MSKSLEKSASLISDYKATFETDHGRRVLIDLMKKHGLLKSTFIPGDPCSTSFNEGARVVVLGIFGRLKINVEKYVKQIEELNKYNDSLGEEF